MNAELQELYRALINSPQRLQYEYNAKHSVLNTGALPTTVTMRRKRKIAPAKRARPKRAAARRAIAKIKRGKRWYAKKFQVQKFAKRQRATAKSRAKKPICFNRRVTLLSLLKRIPAVKTPMAKLFG